MPEDDLWDEHAWESFLRKDDERLSRYMNHLIGFLGLHPMPEAGDRMAMARWEARLRAYLRQRGWYPDDAERALEEEEEEGAADAGQTPGAPLETPWDALFEVDEDPEMEASTIEGLNALPVYRMAFELANILLAWSDEIPGDQKDSALVQFCTNTLQIPANIARGHGLGYDRDTLGGNIACVKRALQCANAALSLFPELKSMPYMDAAGYRDIYERLFETRNEVGLYVQELRRRFDLGIE
ncbi:MAG: hypothetical protein R2834_15325 [Rhodothermales bacterium]